MPVARANTHALKSSNPPPFPPARSLEPPPRSTTSTSGPPCHSARNFRYWTKTARGRRTPNQTAPTTSPPPRARRKKPRVGRSARRQSSVRPRRARGARTAFVRSWIAKQYTPPRTSAGRARARSTARSSACSSRAGMPVSSLGSATSATSFTISTRFAPQTVPSAPGTTATSRRY